MIFRRYGTTYQSVDTNFDSLALNEIAFRRNREESIPAEGFDDTHEVMSTHELTAEAEGDVQDETERSSKRSSPGSATVSCSSWRTSRGTTGPRRSSAPRMSSWAVRTAYTSATSQRPRSASPSDGARPSPSLTAPLVGDFPTAPWVPCPTALTMGRH